MSDTDTPPPPYQLDDPLAAPPPFTSKSSLPLVSPGPTIWAMYYANIARKVRRLFRAKAPVQEVYEMHTIRTFE
ncbi:hypothetical protein C8R44DRAFT_882820 [Mycena epipterygia]|nr:hypothetical protein C8R44DRAFT_882820 [Mycena epipterygia]